MSETLSIKTSRQAIRPDAYKWLAAYLQNGTIPHALIFTGIEGTGRREAAIDFAMACNCGDENRSSIAHPCRECRSCIKIQSDHHPDIIEIKPSGQFIKIAQIREIRYQISMKPFEAIWRIVIIRNAQAMNPSASNALLKMLEEPPDRSLLILITEQRSDLLPTVVSRCKTIRFTPVSRDRLISLLIEQTDISPEDAVITAAMANGSVTQALRLIQMQWVHYRNWLLDATELKNPDRKTPLSTRSRLAIAEKIVRDKEKLPSSLEILESWLRDLLMAKYHPEKIIHKDLSKFIINISKRVSIHSILSKIEAVQSTQKKIKRNMNMRLAMENLMLRI